MMSKFRIFLLKRMKSQNDNPMEVVCWNRSNRLLACAYRSGSVIMYHIAPSREKPGSISLENPQPIEHHRHPVTALAWSDNGVFLSIGDKTGKVTFWKKRDKSWKQALTNSSVASPVKSIKWSKKNDMCCICYEDSTVACVNEAELFWSKNFSRPAEFVEFSPKGKTILLGTVYGEVLTVNPSGVETGAVQLPCLSKSNSDPKIVALEWHKRVLFGLLIVFQGGQIQMMRNESDSTPIAISIDIELTAATWFKSGTSFAVAGVKSDGKCVVEFLTAKGDLIREFEVHGARITSLSLDPHDTMLAMSIGCYFSIAQIIPRYLWAFSNHTLLYAYRSNDDDDCTVIYYNHKTDEKRVISVESVTSVSGGNNHFVILMERPRNTSELLVTDSIGVTLHSTILDIQPTTLTMSNKTIGFSTQHAIGIWRYEEEDKPQIIDFVDNVNAIHITAKSLIACISSQIVILDIRSLSELNRFSIGFSAESLRVNNDGTVLAAFDALGTLLFYTLADGMPAGSERKEAWCMAWATDNPSQFTALERQKLVEFQTFVPEERGQCLSHIAKFEKLEILTVDLLKLMRNPLNPGKKIFRAYPSKLLRELRRQLAERPETSTEDILEFCKANNHERLWNEVAENAMLEMNFPIAEKCFLETTNYQSLQFIKRVRAMKDANLQRAQVLSYLGRFDEAQAIYNSIDRVDLAIEMRQSVGDFEKVIDIIGPRDVGNDESIQKAFNNVGDINYEVSNFEMASASYASAKNDEKLAICLYRSNDISGMEALMDKLPSTSPVLSLLGRLFVSMGAVDNAVAAFTACGDSTSAIDACARMNHWKPALLLSGKGKNNEILNRMRSYAAHLIENGQTSAAIDFYSRAGLSLESAKLLLREGDSLLSRGLFKKAKKLFIFSGIQIEQHRQGAFDGGTTAAERLDGLMRDEEASSSGLIDEIWRKSEAVHFYLLAHQKMFARKWLDALICAIRVFDEYSDIIKDDRSAALLALTAMKTRHYSQMSRAMTILEHYDEYSEERRKKFEEIAIDVFVKNAPLDPRSFGTFSCNKCGAAMTMLNCRCQECGNRYKTCVATGRLVMDHAIWECKICKHCVLIDEAEDLVVCPLCHHQITA